MNLIDMWHNNPIAQASLRQSDNDPKRMGANDWRKIRPDKTIEQRRALCASCPELRGTRPADGSVGALNRCGKCGCFMLTKTALTTTVCPLRKW